jgi:hypothetical protein
MNLTTCRSCKAPMAWATNVHTGKNVPIDPDPVDNGNLVLVEIVPGAKLQVRYVKTYERTGSMPRYVSHFSTCPNAAEHRKS